jgi:hypothetical protein
MDDEHSPEVLPDHKNQSEIPKADKGHRRLVRRILVGAIFILMVRVVVHFSRRWFPTIWDDLHFVNFIVAAIPTVLSILFAFVIDKDLESHMRIRWRISIVGVGMLYSLFLWHQQDLTDRENAKQTASAIGTAVTQANAHSDKKLGEVQKQVIGLGSSLSQTQQSLQSQIGKTETDLNTSIGKVGKPEPPVPAKLVFSLWDIAASADHPVLLKAVHPDKDGNFPIEFSFINASESTADQIDVWVDLCNSCSFVKDPDGFEHPTGIDDHVRHRSFGSLNPDVVFQKITMIVKAPVSSSFQVGFRYTCKNCARKIGDRQIATITEELGPTAGGPDPTIPK